MLRSSRTLKYLGQYGFLVGAVAWVGNCVFFIFRGLITGDWNFDEIIAPGIIGLVHLAAYFYFKDKFAVAEFGGQTVKIISDKRTIETTWESVETIDIVLFSSPPIYTIRIKDVKGYYIFWNAAFGVLWFDFSDLGTLISQKKKDLIFEMEI